MTSRDARPSLASELAAAADAYQAAAVIPHCSVCTKPCCRLDALVLELEWKQIRTFWKLGESRKTFDRELAAGKGPEEIRAANGLYYVHSKPCPAYDLTGHTCTIYGQDIKPEGCSDFPVYEDMGSVTADLRCEAVNLDALVARLARAVGPAFRIVQSADAEFPFLVTLTAKKTVKKAPGRRPPRA